MIEIYVFHCGHGDMVLIRLPGDRWGMIDCYLPKQSGIREQFFGFLEEKKVKTFDFVFQTHPDRDHYHGMQVVFEHFLEQGAKIGHYIDTGLNARSVRELLQDVPGGSKEYEDLQDCLRKWRAEGQLSEWGELAARYLSFVPKGYDKEDRRIEFVPIGPDPGERRRITTEDLQRLADNPRARPEANDLSLVIVLAVTFGDRTLTVLLGADAGIEGLGWALEYWKEQSGRTGRDPGFHVIKVPHHGSIKSHIPALCLMKRIGTGADVAAVSAGTRKALPDREVLRDYLRNGWSVMATTTRRRKPAVSLPMMLADRGTPDDQDVGRHLIRLSWTPLDGLSVEPAAAYIKMDDLAHYETTSP